MKDLTYLLIAMAVANASTNNASKPREWYRMAKKDKVAEILIYDQIGVSWYNDNAVGAKQFDEDLKALGDVDQILLRVNSPGGDAFEGLAIYTTLTNHPANITARVDGIAASAASLVVMAADAIVMPKNTFMLVHEPSGMVYGKSGDMDAMSADLKRMTESFAVTYAERSGQTPEAVRSLMTEDRLMTATEAASLGFCDQMDDKAAKMVAMFDMNRLPTKIQKVLRPIMSAPTSRPNPTGRRSPALRTVSSTNDLKYAKDVAAACQLARRPDMITDFLDQQTPIEEVRTQLLRTRANAPDNSFELFGQQGQPTNETDDQAQSAWLRSIERVNAQVTNGRS